MKDKLLSCIEDKNKYYVPIWFMRQAGRYLPEFREIRKENPNFINLCLNSKLIKDVVLAEDYGWRKKLSKQLKYNFGNDFDEIYSGNKLIDINL